MAKRLKSFRLGDRTEILAEMFLNTLAFTTKVPRQEDIGHDFICFLSPQKGDYFYAKEAFTVQVKSDKRKIVYRGKGKLQWLRNLENPFYFLIGYKKQLRVEIFSTYRILEEMLMKGEAENLTIYFDSKHEGKYYAYTVPDTPGIDEKYDQFVHLGEPIIQVSLEELMKDESHKKYLTILKQWVRNDRANIIGDKSGLYWINIPKEYKKNESPSFDKTKYYLGSNIDKLFQIFFKSGHSIVKTDSLFRSLQDNNEDLHDLAEDILKLCEKHAGIKL